jgi:hypothetical protein
MAAHTVFKANEVCHHTAVFKLKWQHRLLEWGQGNTITFSRILQRQSISSSHRV